MTEVELLQEILEVVEALEVMFRWVSPLVVLMCLIGGAWFVFGRE